MGNIGILYDIDGLGDVFYGGKEQNKDQDCLNKFKKLVKSK